jgi:hypothetical protein
MDLKDTYKYLVGAYCGIQEMDNYPLKEFVLKDINDYIEQFIEENPIPNFDYEKEREQINEELSLKTKLQDSLLVLPKVNASIELILLVKARLKEIKEQEKN